jgi:metal-dependent amidase/aminoacylase/carboxypeptidase family protein
LESLVSKNLKHQNTYVRFLAENGFNVEYQISDIPTSWLASWSNGEGGPVIALGSDFDGSTFYISISRSCI